MRDLMNVALPSLTNTPDLFFRIGRITISTVTDYLVWPHSREVLFWRLLLDRLPTEDRLYRSGFQLASKCSVCGDSSESVDHLFLKCPLAITPWEAVFSAIQRRVSVDTWGSFFRQAMSISFSDQIRVLWRAAIHMVVWSVWYSRNQWIFERKSVCFRAALSLVWRSVYEVNRLVIGCMRNGVDDLLILHWFGLSGRPGKAPVIRSVVWSPPAPWWIQVNADGAALGSLGVGGCGLVDLLLRHVSRFPLVRFCF
ncbi:hypothetical protein Dsin_028900 [Dipteronia sinensis]|uniref:Reverse transcriptase zinc-binding domain-containing protein n=1 Tax=Dipteronia sinensis TaxID=43782 RepID=A0AAE0DV16_9ROSI|nr:hypothetical protein Dsin_028900 [Dipteronia sinensis]